MHVFTIDVNLAQVVKILVKRLFEVLTYDFLGVKSQMNRNELERPSLSIIGYQDFSLINNMGIVFWLMLLSLVFLIINLVVYIFKEKVDILTKDENPSKYIGIIKKVS